MIDPNIREYFSGLGKKSSKSPKHYYGFSDPKIQAKILAKRVAKKALKEKSDSFHATDSTKDTP